MNMKCGVYNQNNPIRCMLHAGHLGMHSTVDNAQFKHVPTFKDVLVIQWPNAADAMFGEMHDSAVLWGQRVALAGSIHELKEIGSTPEWKQELSGYRYR